MHDNYLGAGSKEVAEIFPVLSGSNLLPTAPVWDVYHYLQLACGNPQSHICHTTPHQCLTSTSEVTTYMALYKPSSCINAMARSETVCAGMVYRHSFGRLEIS